MPSSKLEPPDSIHLRAAIGWLELGNPSEAADEVARISHQVLGHPDVLEVRWQICAATKSWDAALPIGAQLVETAPDRVDGWIHRSYALRRSRDGNLEKAWEALLPAAKLFPEQPIVPYNLACYAAQLARPDEAWEWLQQAIRAGGGLGEIKRMALADRDLEPLWARISKL